MVGGWERLHWKERLGGRVWPPMKTADHLNRPGSCDLAIFDQFFQLLIGFQTSDFFQLTGLDRDWVPF